MSNHTATTENRGIPRLSGTDETASPFDVRANGRRPTSLEMGLKGVSMRSGLKGVFGVCATILQAAAAEAFEGTLLEPDKTPMSRARVSVVGHAGAGVT